MAIELGDFHAAPDNKAIQEWSVALRGLNLIQRIQNQTFLPVGLTESFSDGAFKEEKVYLHLLLLRMEIKASAAPWATVVLLVGLQ